MHICCYPYHLLSVPYHKIHFNFLKIHLCLTKMANSNFGCVWHTINCTRTLCICYVNIYWWVNVITTHLLLLSVRYFLSIGMEINDKALWAAWCQSWERCEGYIRAGLLVSKWGGKYSSGYKLGFFSWSFLSVKGICWYCWRWNIKR